MLLHIVLGLRLRHLKVAASHVVELLLRVGDLDELVLKSLEGCWMHESPLSLSKRLEADQNLFEPLHGVLDSTLRQLLHSEVGVQEHLGQLLC